MCPGVERVFLFGSWARYVGRSGRPQADIDVLVVGMPDREDLDEAAERTGRRWGREVNVTVRSPQWWDGGQDGFHAEVTARPLVPVLGSGVADHEAELGQEAGCARSRVGSGSASCSLRESWTGCRRTMCSRGR